MRSLFRFNLQPLKQRRRKLRADSLGIELEGEIHKYHKKYDEYRIKYLDAFGIKIERG